MKHAVLLVTRWSLHGGRPRRWMPRGRGVWVLVRRNLEFLLTQRTRYALSVTARRFRAGRDGAGSTDWQYYEVPSMKKKSAKGQSENVRHLAAVESDILGKLMPLIEHMCVTRYDDGDPREAGWVTLRTKGAAWSVQVKDPDSGNSFEVLDSSLDKALEAAALLLACDEAPWAPDAFLKRQGTKKGR